MIKDFKLFPSGSFFFRTKGNPLNLSKELNEYMDKLKVHKCKCRRKAVYKVEDKYYCKRCVLETLKDYRLMV